MKKVCMVVQDKNVKGGIAAVINGYYGSKLEEDFDLIYVESYKDGNKITKLLKAICGYIRFLKILLVDKPDIIHIHSSFGPSFYRKIPFIYLSNWLNKPIINHIHGADFEEFYSMASNYKKKLIEKIYKKCSIIIALSHEWKEKLKLIVDEDYIEIIENYSILHEDAIKNKIKRPLNYKVLFLGEIGKRKGCYDIPKVIKSVLKRIPNVKFILAGSGDETQILELAKKHKVENYIELPGWIRGKDKDSLLRECDVFFLPSYNEGMPMSILDAMGYGLPIVSTNVGGIPKIVRENENGYCYNPGDIEGFANSIIDLLESLEINNIYSLASYNIVKNQYSLESHINLLEKVYKKCLEMK